MADTKISALTSATTPLVGTEVLPIVQSSTTKKVSVADLTVGRDIAVKTLSATDGVWIGNTQAVYSEKANITSGANSSAYFLIRNTNTGSSAYTGYYLNASGNAWAMRMGSSAGNSNALEWVIDAVGSPVVRWSMDTGGNLIQGTAAKGVNFTANTPAAGMTSQLLNWYEEGTWTATLTGSTTAPTTPVTTTAKYTRIGRQVSVFFQFDNVSTVGASGELRVTGLPFTVGSGGLGSAAAYGQGTAPFVCYPSPTTTYLRFYDMVTLSAININATATVFFYAQVTYMV